MAAALGPRSKTELGVTADSLAQETINVSRERLEIQAKRATIVSRNCGFSGMDNGDIPAYSNSLGEDDNAQ